MVEVALDRPHGFCVLLDEHRTRRTARERLDTERARTGEEIEDAGAVDRADEVEDVLAHAVRKSAGISSPCGATSLWPFLLPAITRIGGSLLA